jgi:hypothetical protein
MNIGFVFLALALAAAAIAVAAYHWPPEQMGFDLQVVTVVVAAAVLGGLAVLALVFGGLG